MLSFFPINKPKPNTSKPLQQQHAFVKVAQVVFSQAAVKSVSKNTNKSIISVPPPAHLHTKHIRKTREIHDAVDLFPWSCSS